jgi:regulator of protease activity HflC (stomatin/prohibitin superfamily)
MLFLAGIFLIGGIIAVILSRSNENVHILKNIGSAAIVLSVLLILAAGMHKIDSGQVGVVRYFGQIQSQTLNDGLNFVNPLYTVDKVDVRSMVYTMSGIRDEGTVKGDDAIHTLSSDNLDIVMDITVTYRIMDAPHLLRTVGEDYIEKIIRPESRTALRNASSMFTAIDIISTKRAEFIGEVTRELELAFKPRGIMFENVLLRNVKLPETVESAINDKIASEQRSQQMVYEIQRTKQEADRIRIEAQGKADAQKILNEGLSPAVIELRKIEMQQGLINSPNSKIIILGESKTTPLINFKE